MLVVNCGAGELLPFLWQAGFDLLATEADNELRKLARKMAVPDLAIQAADDMELPFENESFDWTIAHLRSGDKKRLEAVSNEACRVSRRGLMLTFWNENSPPIIWWKIWQKKKWPEAGASWHKVLQAVKKSGAGKARGCAILACPVSSWKKNGVFGWLNRQVSFLPIGAWAVVRVDFQGARPITPMPLRIDSSMAEVERNMEWAHKRDANAHQESVNEI